MYVSQTASASRSQKARRTNKQGGDSSSFRLPSDNTQRPTGSVGTTQSVAPLGALLAVQEVDQVQNDRRKTVSKGREILDILDELKIGLLAGGISSEKLQRLETVVNDVSVPPGDSNLQNIMDAIVLRARVELAKRRK